MFTRTVLKILSGFPKKCKERIQEIQIWIFLIILKSNLRMDFFKCFLHFEIHASFKIWILISQPVRNLMAWLSQNRALIRPTGGDSSNKGCFGRKTNLFRESGDFAGNRETWEIFREIWDIFGTLSKDLILHVIKQYIYSDMHPLYALYFMYFDQPRPQGFSLKKWVAPHPFFKGKALGTRLYFDTWKRLNSPWYEKINQQRFQLK